MSYHMIRGSTKNARWHIEMMDWIPWCHANSVRGRSMHVEYEDDYVSIAYVGDPPVPAIDGIPVCRGCIKQHAAENGGTA